MSDQERDPHGLSSGTPGAKFDAGKIRAALVLGDFSRALQAVAMVGTFGARKYSPSGWLEVPNAQQRYEDAMLRHWLKLSTGETTDEDSGLSHASHLAWNALAILELQLRGIGDE